MKALLVIPLLTAACLAIAAVALSIAGIRVHMAGPVETGIIAATAGMIGIVPIVWKRPRDQAAAVQLALAGTVLHLMSAVAMGLTLLATHVVADHRRLGFWLVGGYWISLFVTVDQLRRLVYAAPIAKAEK
jgi:hypothetical protein